MSSLAVVRAVLGRALSRFLRHGCTHLAASITFRVLFAIFPLAIVLGAIFGVVSDLAGFRPDVVDAIVQNAPLDEDGSRRLRRILEDAAGNSSVGLLGAVGLVWAASGMMAAVRAALNRAWDAEDTRPWLVGKAVDVLLVFGASLVVVVAVALNLTVRLAQELVEHLSLDFGIAEALLGLVAPFVLVFLVVAVVFRVVPTVSPPISQLVGPAIFVAAVFTAAQIAFAFYLQNVARYDAIYGSLGAGAAFMFFVYLASLVFLFGAEIAAVAPDVRAELRSAGDDGAEAPTPFAERMKQALRGLVLRS